MRKFAIQPESVLDRAAITIKASKQNGHGQIRPLFRGQVMIENSA
jgi:hypothetical protein